MNENWKIAGHQKQIELLSKSIDSGKLAHAYIFAGPAFVGKRTLAHQFAKQLLEQGGIQQERFQPDFLEVKGEEAIKIEQIRDLIYKLSLKPYSAKYKVAVIDNAEKMTVEAQNALLKVLEEPKEYTIIIMVAANPNKLLRTIASRAQKINFGLVEPADYKDLIPKILNEETKNLIISFAYGRPGLALNIASNQEFTEELEQTNKYYALIRSNDLIEKLKLAYELAGLETLKLKQVLDFWQIKYEQELINAADSKVAADLTLVSQTQKYLDQNVNSKLLLTNLMLNLQ